MTKEGQEERRKSISKKTKGSVLMAGAVLASVLVMSIAVFSPIQGGFATTNTMIDNNQNGNASTGS